MAEGYAAASFPWLSSGLGLSWANLLKSSSGSEAGKRENERMSSTRRGVFGPWKGWRAQGRGAMQAGSIRFCHSRIQERIVCSPVTRAPALKQAIHTRVGELYRFTLNSH